MDSSQATSLMPGVVVRPLPRFSDERGWLVDQTIHLNQWFENRSPLQIPSPDCPRLERNSLISPAA